MSRLRRLGCARRARTGERQIRTRSRLRCVAAAVSVTVMSTTERKIQREQGAPSSSGPSFCTRHSSYRTAVAAVPTRSSHPSAGIPTSTSVRSAASLSTPTSSPVSSSLPARTSCTTPACHTRFISTGTTSFHLLRMSRNTFELPTVTPAPALRGSAHTPAVVSGLAPSPRWRTSMSEMKSVDDERPGARSSR